MNVGFWPSVASPGYSVVKAWRTCPRRLIISCLTDAFLPRLNADSYKLIRLAIKQLSFSPTPLDPVSSFLLSA
ncbi:hypothetical protein KCV07_g24, partial [Aureobasidium melanogenum]